MEYGKDVFGGVFENWVCVIVGFFGGLVSIGFWGGGESREAGNRIEGLRMREGGGRGRR